MKVNFNLKRVRRATPDPKIFLRLHRGEFGHDYKKKIDNDRYYADTESLILSIKKSFRLKKNQHVILGQGAEGLIKDIMMWHSTNNKKKKILIYEPNYFMYEHFSKLFGYKIFRFRLNLLKSYYIDHVKIINYIKKNKINLLALVNPSAPLEKRINKISLLIILKYCKKNNIFVIFDEVYENFYKKNAINNVIKFDNFIVIKTFSKMAGYPGLKAGFAICGKKIFQSLNSSRLSVELPSYVVNKCIKIIKLNIIKKNERIIFNSIKWGNKNFPKIGIKSLTRSIIWFTIDLKNKKIKEKILKSLNNKKILVNNNFFIDLKNLISFTVSHLNNLKYIFNVIKKTINDKY